MVLLFFIILIHFYYVKQLKLPLCSDILIQSSVFIEGIPVLSGMFKFISMDFYLLWKEALNKRDPHVPKNPLPWSTVSIISILPD